MSEGVIEATAVQRVDRRRRSKTIAGEAAASQALALVTGAGIEPVDVQARRLVVEVCLRLSDGEEIHSILRTPGMPARRTFYEWLAKFPDLAARYTKAKEDLAESLDSQIALLGDDTTVANFQARRVQIDTLKWRASKLHPKQYGDRIQTDVNAQVAVNAMVLDATVLLPEQRDALRLALAARQDAKAD